MQLHVLRIKRPQSMQRTHGLFKLFRMSFSKQCKCSNLHRVNVNSMKTSFPQQIIFAAPSANHKVSPV